MAGAGGFTGIPNSRRTVFRCGRRFGKSLMAQLLVGDGMIHGQSWGYFTPSYRFGSEIYRELRELLAPIVVSSNKVEQVIRVKGGGSVEFWTLLDDRAGRSRKYHGVVLDEVAFVEGDMAEIWSKAIQPALLDYRGDAWAMSTPAGNLEENWFFNICEDKKLGWTEFHAPSASNPYLPTEEFAKLEASNSPEVFQQEYLAEFVDWRGKAFFPIQCFLVENEPIPNDCPDKVDIVYLTIDTAIKAEKEHNSTACVIWGYNGLVKDQHSITILDWDIIQVESVEQAGWLGNMYRLGQEWADKLAPRAVFDRAYIEDKATGDMLIRQAQREGMRVEAIDSALTAKGKEGRAWLAMRPVQRGDVKITEHAYNKLIAHKGRTANHLINQITSFRVGLKNTEMDLLDAALYGVLIPAGQYGDIKK
jgi:hypothetical protein